MSEEGRRSPERRRRKLYGRRKGPKLSERQSTLRRTLLSDLVYTPGGDPAAAFANTVQVSSREAPEGEGGRGSIKEIWLEIGFGAGEHLHTLARENPQVGMIGAEPYETGVAKLLTKLADQPLNNVRLYEGDGRDILESLPEASLSRFFLLFPDPWPKTRHHKRRFLQMETLDLLAKVLKPGAELRFATDDKSYLPYALERLMAHPAFVWTAAGQKDWKKRPEGWPPTRYEAKAIKGPPTYLRFVRRAKI